MTHICFLWLSVSFIYHIIGLKWLESVKLRYSISRHVCLCFDVLGFPCRLWVLEFSWALWRWNEWHHNHSDSEGEGQMGTRHTCRTTEKHTAGIRYIHACAERCVPNFPFSFVLHLVSPDCAFTWKWKLLQQLGTVKLLSSPSDDTFLIATLGISSNCKTSSNKLTKEDVLYRKVMQHQPDSPGCTQTKEKRPFLADYSKLFILCLKLFIL